MELAVSRLYESDLRPVQLLLTFHVFCQNTDGMSSTDFIMTMFLQLWSHCGAIMKQLCFCRISIVLWLSSNCKTESSNDFTPFNTLLNELCGYSRCCCSAVFPSGTCPSCHGVRSRAYPGPGCRSVKLKLKWTNKVPTERAQTGLEPRTLSVTNSTAVHLLACY